MTMQKLHKNKTNLHKLTFLLLNKAKTNDKNSIKINVYISIREQVLMPQHARN